MLILLPIVLVGVLKVCFSDSNNHLLLFDSNVSTYWPERRVTFVDGDELMIARGRVAGGSFFNADTRRNLELSEDGPQPLTDSWGPRAPQRYGVAVPWLVFADSEILIRHVPTTHRLATAEEKSWIRDAHVNAMRNWKHRPEWMTDRLLDAGAVGGGKFTSVRPLYLVADLLVILSIGAAVVAIVCLGQWWWCRDWTPENGKGTVRRHATGIGVLAAVLVLDVVVVMMSVRFIAPPFCTPTTTLLGTIHRDQSFTQAEVVYDGVKARLVFDIPRSEWPATWVRITQKIYLPRTTNNGLITPYRTTWWHRFWFRLTEEHGGEQTEQALRRELASVLRANPDFGPHMPSWYWDKLSAEDGVTITYNYWLVLHDMLFAGVLAAVGWCVLTLAVAGAKRLRGPGPGFCSKCRYDLRGLKSDICPECGTSISRGSNRGSSAQEVVLRTVSPGDLPTLFAHQLDTEACRMAAFTADDPTDRAAFDAHWVKILAKDTVIARTVVVRDEAGGEHVAGHIASFMRGEEREVTYWIGREHWGNGVATRALKLLLAEDETRPMHARAAADNAPSIRVLEKCGFVEDRRERGFANARGEEIEEVVMRLR